MTDGPNLPPPPESPPTQVPPPPNPGGGGRSPLRWVLIGAGGCLVLVLLSTVAFVGCLAVIGTSGGGGGGPVAPAGESGDEAESRQANEGGTETAVVKVGGTPGMRFTGSVGNIDSTRSVDGVTPAEYEVKYSSRALDMDSVFVDFYKEMNAQAEYPEGTLEVQIVVDGQVVQESSSSANDGYVSITWSPEG